MNERWAQPTPVTDLDIAFGAAGRLDKLLPAIEEIPEEFQRHNGTPWNAIQARWFFHGLPVGVQFKAKEGIDPEKVFRHLRAIQGSYACKHEHKEAGIAYLMSLWLVEVVFP
jgi:hypothetical protein